MIFFAYESILKFAFAIAIVIEKWNRNQKLARFITARRSSVRNKILDQGHQKFVALKQTSLATGESLTIIWFHVASAGELEQAIPVARSLHKTRNAHFILTYFSPEAEHFLNNFPAVLASFALPVDCRLTFNKIIEKFNISHLIFVRYDLWPALIFAAKKNNVTLNLISATKNTARNRSRFSPDLIFKKFLLNQFNNICVVDREDLEAFKLLKLRPKLFVSGDSKWARAKERAHETKINGPSTGLYRLFLYCNAQKFVMKRSVFVFGSPHEAETKIAQMFGELKLKPFIIFVPHETNSAEIAKYSESFMQQKFKCVTLSQWHSHLKAHDKAQENEDLISLQINHPSLKHYPKLDTSCGDSHWPVNATHQKHSALESLEIDAAWPLHLLAEIDVLLVDRIGLLAELYGFADVAVVGGGFDGQLHNTLEPASHPVTTVFGNNIRRAAEARRLVSHHAALAFETPAEMFQFLTHCVKVEDDDAKGHETRHRAAAVKRHAYELFQQIPDTSEIVSKALFTEPP